MRPRRIGVDMGNVLATGWRTVDGALWGMMELERIFGKQNVFVVSYAGQASRGVYAAQLEQQFGVGRERVRFTDARTGFLFVHSCMLRVCSVLLS